MIAHLSNYNFMNVPALMLFTPPDTFKSCLFDI
jgi:hypothetical protein